MFSFLPCESCGCAAAASKYRTAFHAILCPECNRAWKDEAYRVRDADPVAWAFDTVDA